MEIILITDDFLKMFYVIDRNIFQFWESALVLGF